MGRTAKDAKTAKAGPLPWATAMVEDKTPVAIRGTTERIAPQMAWGITSAATDQVADEIAGRTIRHTTPAAVCPAADRIACETTDEGLRAVTAETIRQTMYDTTVGTMYETARRTKDQTTSETTSQIVR